MKESDKHQLEGLLQARSDDLRESRMRRRRRPVEDPRFEPPVSDGGQKARTRACDGCGEQIALRRLRALPSAKRCLDCQRASEQAATPS